MLIISRIWLPCFWLYCLLFTAPFADRIGSTPDGNQDPHLTAHATEPTVIHQRAFLSGLNCAGCKFFFQRIRHRL